MTDLPPIGLRIKRARERKRWTQRDLARAVGVNTKTIDNYENGRTRPRNSIGALEEVLGISLNGTPAPAPETEWERWERETLNNPDIPPELARAIVQDARRAARAGGPGAAGSSSAPSPASSGGRTAGRHRAGG